MTLLDTLASRRVFLSFAAGSLATARFAQAAPLLGAGNELGAEHHIAPNAWMEVDRAVFNQNVRNVREMVTGNAKICAVLKADAYGVGIEALMPSVLEAGFPYIGIASNEEARIVRAHGFKGQIMRLRTATPEEVEDALEYDLEEAAGNVEVAQEIGRIGQKHGRTMRIHLALNSGGMSRNGLELGTQAGKQDALTIVGTSNLSVVGVTTHFAYQDKDKVLEGVAAFNKDAEWLFANSGLKRADVLLHVAASLPALFAPESHLDMVRIGAFLYGYAGPRPAYQNAMAFKSRVASVNAYPAGNTVSYDGTYALTRDSLLANIPVGYSDGYRRAFTNKGTVLIQGKRVPVVGKVTMNTLMVDVTDLPGVRIGDEVVLFGKQGQDEITSEEIEEIAGVLLLDLLTVWGNSNPKVIK